MPDDDRSPTSTPLMEVRGVSKRFHSTGILSKKPPVVAAENVSFSVDRGQAVALVGESGSGKSTIAKLLVRLEKADGGEIRLDGEDLLVKERRAASLDYRGRVQMVFQDPFGSLNPVHNVSHHIERPLLRHRRADARTVRKKALELLETVGLEPPEEYIGRHPYELSGGQRQRVAIARALAVEPDLLVADEPTSMLDVSIRMDILTLLDDLKRRSRLGIILITHDLASARFLADRILVLYRGRIVEDGPSDEVVSRPAHPYTRALLDAISNVEAGLDTTADSPAESTPRFESIAPTAGCPFASRCPDVMDHCRERDPAPRLVDDRRVRCHLYPEESARSDDGVGATT